MLKLTIAGMAALLLAMGVISIPYVQTWIIQEISGRFLEKLNHEITLDYVNIRWFDTVLLRNVLIRDTQGVKMVEAEKIILDFKITELFASNSVNFDQAILVGPDVNMFKNAPDDEFNFTYFIDVVKEALQPERPTGTPFTIDEVVLRSGEFQLFREDREYIEGRFDHHHFTFQNIEASLESFLIKPGHISFDIKDMQLLDSATQLQVNRLSTRFISTRKSMVFQNMTAALGKSIIEQSMVFKYFQPSSMRYFEDSVTITSNIKNSLLHSSDLGVFVPAVQKYEQYYRLKGFFEGPVNRFNASNITVEFGRQSRLEGYITMYGLPNLEETFINAKLSQATFYMSDLAPYMNQANLERASKFGKVHFDGRFSGFLNDFVSNAVFETDLGHVQTDINLKINETNRELSTYSGKLVTRDFDLGRFLGDTVQYQTLEMNGQIEGKGFTRENARFTLKSEIQQLGFKAYNYQNIITDAAFAEQFFNGQLTIDDPNLKFQADASIDLSDNRDIIQINARLDTAYLQPLNITEQHAFASSYIFMDMTGLELDELLGTISLNDTYVEYESRSLYLDTMKVISERDSLSRNLIVDSPNIRLRLFGDFDYSDFFRDAVGVFQEYTLLFKNDSIQMHDYYAEKEKDLREYYYLDYDIELLDFNPVIQLFVPDIRFAPESVITGSFSGGPTSIIQMNTTMDRFGIGPYSFRGNVLNINSAKVADTSFVFGQYYLSSEVQYYNETPRTSGLMTEVDWRENHLAFISSIYQFQQNNHAKISGEIEFLPTYTVAEIHPSEILILDKYWKFSSDNQILLQDKNIEFIDLFLENADQKISVNGVISEDPDENLFISVKNFDLQNINPITDKDFQGTVNGYADIRNYYTEKEIDSRVSLKHFHINDFLVGDVLAKSVYENDNKRFNVQTTVNRLGTDIIGIQGYLQPSAPDQQLALTGHFNKANLNIAEPFIEGVVSGIQGEVNGEVDIGGRFAYPELRGTCVLEHGSFLFDYLNTAYRLDGVVAFDKDEISVDQLIIRDESDHTGIITGKATHTGFKELVYDFRATFENMQLLNTTPDNNALYYGTAYGTGDMRFYGRQKNMYIDANARSEKGTKVFIPLEGSTEVVQEEFITFVSNTDRSDSARTSRSFREIVGSVNLEGINLNMDLDITPDAYLEIIFDLTAGDIIRGRGNGDIKLQIDTKGDFMMFGDFEISEGGYNFTMYNIINKEFEILPGSNISWTGDPYAANLDIQAVYRQLASLTPILRIDEEEVRANPEVSRKYPAFVMLDIQGDLRYPEIDFDIELEDYPKNAVINGISLETQWSAFKNKLDSDEQELKRQVFSLIILKNFSSEDAFNVGGSVGRSVSEFISNQISYWITQFDENLVIDVELGDLDQEAFNTFQLRMSYSFMDGRLRVTRDGGFTDQNSNADVASVLGDWSVEYLLTPDGKYRAKIYNKTNFNTLNSNLRNTSTTTGFSLMHTHSFNEIRDLFSNARKKALEENRKEKAQSAEGISRRNTLAP